MLLEKKCFRRLIGITFIVMLAVSTLLPTKAEPVYQYRGEPRWSGPLDNPNLFGILMAAGLSLVFGLVVEPCCVIGFSKLQTRQIPRPLFYFFGAIGACILFVALLRTYSRGAWLGAIVGYIWLILQTVFKWGRLQNGATQWFRCQILPLAVAMGCLVALMFWSFQQTEWRPLRRAFSVGNINDASWRLRIDAWEGAMRVVAHKPWMGNGWKEPEQLYYNHFQRPKLSEGAAIQLNDYFIVAMTWGIPTLICFVAFVWSAFCPRAGLEPEPGSREAEEEWLKTTCRAGVVVLLVGFWFDGGLFKWVLAVPFWLLLELGRSNPLWERRVEPVEASQISLTSPAP